MSYPIILNEDFIRRHDDFLLRVATRWRTPYRLTTTAPGALRCLADTPDSRTTFCGQQGTFECGCLPGDGICPTCYREYLAQLDRPRWTPSDVAREVGLKDAASARAWIARANLRHLDRAPDGETKRYDSGQVLSARAAMPGRGAGGGRPRTNRTTKETTHG